MINTTIEKQCTVTSSKRVHLSERTSSGVPFYCSKEIIEKVNGGMPSETDFISEEQYKIIKDRFGVPQPKDLLLTTRGTIGVPYLYKSNDKFYFADGNLTWLKDFKSTLSSKYLYYWFQTKEARKCLEAISKGTAQQALSIEGLKRLSIRIPDIKIQDQICEILSAYDVLIENNQKQIKLLEEVAQRLYKEWFVDLRFPGYEQTRIVDGVPVGWKFKKISDVCLQISAGGTPLRSNKNFWKPDKIKWYKTGELKDCWLLRSEECISEEGLNNSSAKLFPAKTILMAIYASPTIGRLGILESEATCNQATLCLIADEAIISWQWLYMKLFELRNDFNAVAKGAGQQNISAEIVKNKEILLPSINVVRQYTEKAENVLGKLRLLQKEIEFLTEARDRLLPKLMNGEIEL